MPKFYKKQKSSIIFKYINKSVSHESPNNESERGTVYINIINSAVHQIVSLIAISNIHTSLDLSLCVHKLPFLIEFYKFKYQKKKKH